MSSPIKITKLSIADIQKKKLENQKISMLTCYDACFASILNQSDVDLLLVGDTGSMILHGCPDTTHATMDMMVAMTRSVTTHAPEKFVVGDMPFLTHRQGIQHAVQCAQRLIQAGANAVKIEDIDGHEDVIQHLVQSGIPVMGHVGLTPQSVHSDGYKVQGKSDDKANHILKQAQQLEKLGCFAIVLECVPSSLAAEITKSLTIPVIGIGAGVEVDGQVLVLQDMLGMNKHMKPKFVRHYAQGFELIQQAVNQFAQDVQHHDYPSEQESYR